MPGERGRAAGRLQQRGQHVDGGRLAGAVGPQEAEDLARRHLERHAGDGGKRAKFLDQVMDLDNRAHGFLALQLKLRN